MPFNPTNQLHSECSGIAVGLLTSCCCHCAHALSSTSRSSPDLRGGTMMASGPAEGRSASTQRSTVAGDAKPIADRRFCTKGHATRRARSARYHNSTDQRVLLPGRLHRPASHGLRPSPPSVTSPSARSRTHTWLTGRYGFPQPNLLRTQQVKHQGSPPPVDVTHDAQRRPPRYGADGPCHRADAVPGWRIEHIRQAPSSSARLCEPRKLCTMRGR